MSPSIAIQGLHVQADDVQRISQGYLLTGQRVALLHPFGNTEFYRHGFHSWSLSSWLRLDRPLPPPQPKKIWAQIDHPTMLEAYPFTSSGVGALKSPNEKVLLLGALGPDAFVQMDPQVLRGLSGNADALWFLGYDDEDFVFAQYARLLGEHMGQRTQKEAPRVWCSWYSLFTQISESIIQDALGGIARLPFDVFQVDDGWQVSMGDWEANEKFPAGMEALAENISLAGFTPGLWLAPLIVQPKSSIYKMHRDWLLHDEQGRPVEAGHNWGSPFYGLDTTHPEVQKWLFETITRVRKWGYNYLKLDFLYASALPGVRYTKMPAEQAYRQGLEIMRQAAGDAYILVCGAPIIASLGLADGARVGPDVAPYWDNFDRSFVLNDLSGPSTLNAIRTTLGRLWLRPLLHVDPDVVFFRTRYNLMDEEQKQLLCDLATIAGFKATSDLPHWLDDAERQALVDFLQAEADWQKTGKYEFNVNGRDIDFSFVRDLWPD